MSHRDKELNIRRADLVDTDLNRIHNRRWIASE